MNRRAWDVASQKYVDESDAVLALAAAEGGGLFPVECELLAPLLANGGLVVHLQSGNAIDDFALVQLGASSVIGVDFSLVTCGAALRRAEHAGLPGAYVCGEARDAPLGSGCADLVYTGKGALPWLPELEGWAAEVHRLLRPGGSFFVYDAHPAAALWTRDADRPAIDPSVDYFGGTRVNTTFPASAIARFGDPTTTVAVEHQWTLAAILSALLGAGLVLQHVGEHPEPFWRPADGSPPAAAWGGALPNSVSILAVRQAPV